MLKCKQTLQDCNCNSKGSPLTGEKQLPYAHIVLLITHSIRAFKLPRPCIFVLETPSKKAFTAVLYLCMFPFRTPCQKAFRLSYPHMFPLRKPFKRPSNYLSPTVRYCKTLYEVSLLAEAGRRRNRSPKNSVGG